MNTANYEDALRVVQQLPPEEQDRLIAEIQDVRGQAAADAQWERVFAQAPDKHTKLTEQLRVDLKAGHTQPLDPHRL